METHNKNKNKNNNNAQWYIYIYMYIKYIKIISGIVYGYRWNYAHSKLGLCTK